MVLAPKPFVWDLLDAIDRPANNGKLKAQVEFFLDACQHVIDQPDIPISTLLTEQDLRVAHTGPYGLLSSCSKSVLKEQAAICKRVLDVLEILSKRKEQYTATQLKNLLMAHNSCQELYEALIGHSKPSSLLGPMFIH